MRGLALVLAALMLLTPLAVAAEGDGSSSDSSSSSTSSSPSPHPEPRPYNNPDGCPAPQRGPPYNDTERAACLQRACREHPDRPECQRDEPKPEPAGQPEARPTGWERWCASDERTADEMAKCRHAIEEYRDARAGHFISFHIDQANATLLSLMVGSTLVIESLQLETGSGNLSVERAGDALRLGDGNTSLVLNDDPTGLVRFKGDDGSVTIRLPASAHVARASDDSVARIEFAGGRIGYIRADHASWLDGRTVLLTGFFAFLIPAPQTAEHDEHTQAVVKQAITDRKVGAEITITAPKPAGAATTTGAGNGSVQVLAYDDVTVQVKVPPRLATAAAPIRVELSSDLHEGRTIVLNLNRSVLPSVDPAALLLHYYDLHSQDDGSTIETEVVFRQASDLADVLDPSNDGGQPEYWVVQDANGLQLMASIPHWSAHAITVGSVARVLAEPNVTYGIVAGGVGTLLAAVAMMWPRRPDDDL
jgi:hypothetical protein